MYRQFNKESYNQEESQYIHDFLAITSALYGVIPADTPIAPYRLDFQTKGKIQGQSLRKFWQSSFDQDVKNEEIILSLLSSEFEEVFSKDLQQNFYQCVFMEEKEGKRKIHSTISKKARGKMVKELISHQIQNIDDPFFPTDMGGRSGRPCLLLRGRKTGGIIERDPQDRMARSGNSISAGTHSR